MRIVWRNCEGMWPLRHAQYWPFSALWRKLGILPVMEDSASSLSSMTDWKPILPPWRGNRDDVRVWKSRCGSAWDQILDGFALFKEFGDGSIDFFAAECIDGQALNDFPSSIVEGPDRH